MKEGDVAERNGNLERAYAAYQRAATLNQPGATAKVEATHRKLVSGYTRAAMQATARQDLKGAVAQWDRVLALDPANETARGERKRAIEGLEKLNQKP